MSPERIRETNRLSWNAATLAHNSHKVDQTRFLRDGGELLFPEELALLGDLAGKRLVHMQCNAGQDSLCLARRGARVVGVDLSDEAINFARSLSRESGIAADFICSDLYEWLESAPPADFDIAFCSYGATCWLPDLHRWARGIKRILRPGGRFVTVEFHPVLGMLEGSGKVNFDYCTHSRPVESPDGVSDYVACSRESLAPSGYQAGVVDFTNPAPCYEFVWSIADILTALLDNGLRLTRFEEYMYSNGCKFFPEMRDATNRRWTAIAGAPTIPMMYGILGQS